MHTTETGQHPSGSAEPQPSLPKLRLVYSPSDGIVERKVYVLANGATAVGRELPHSDGLQLADKRISRVHATFHVDPARREVRIVDEQAKNGTFVNRQRLPAGGAALLSDRDVVRVGDSLVVLRYEPLKPEDGKVPGLLGNSPEMMALRHHLGRIAAGAAPVLILGETGTGKELVAQALHQQGGRSGELIAVNCAAIPETLAESELFGHVAGAFTGAKPHPGFFRAAQKGTLFLDEIGELAAPLQAKLLRVLQEHEVTPLGATKPIPVDVRIVAATHRDLARDVQRGSFREDLYGRLAGIVLSMPPLRARREDIPLLLQHALGEAGSRHYSADLIEALLLYFWPRNVRELLQIAEHLRLLGCDAALLARLSSGNPPPAVPDQALPAADATPFPGHETVTRAHLVALMQAQHGVIAQVAQALGTSRRQVGRMLEHYRLDRKDFRREPD